MRKFAFLFVLMTMLPVAFAASDDQLQRAQAALDRINLFRRIHGLKTIPLDSAAVDACISHANYIDLNPTQIFSPYDEDLSLPGATAEGKAVAAISSIVIGAEGADAITRMFLNYSERGFLLASDFIKAGYGDSPGTNYGSTIAIIRTGETHSPTKLVTPPDGAMGMPASLALTDNTDALAKFGPPIILYGSSESSNLEIVNTVVSSAGLAIDHSSEARTTSGSKPNILKDIVITPKAALPFGALISVVVDYKENGSPKHAEWSFTTSPSGLFDPVLAASAIPGPKPSDTSDADGDGFPANVEIAATTSPTDATSTPFSNMPAPAPVLLDVLKSSIKLNFKKLESDSIQFNGTLNVPPGFLPAGYQVIVDVGGAVRAFSLNDKFSATNGFSSVKLSKPKDNITKYKVKLSKGNFAVDLDDDGLKNTTTTGANVTVPFTVYFNNTILRKDVTSTYSAKADSSGRTK